MSQHTSQANIQSLQVLQNRYDDLEIKWSEASIAVSNAMTYLGEEDWEGQLKVDKLKREMLKIQELIDSRSADQARS